MPCLHGQAVPGLLETSPGVRSCMIEYDQRVLPLVKLLQLLEQVEAELPPVMFPSLCSPKLHCSPRVCCTDWGLGACLHC